MTKVANAKQMPKIFYGLHMVPGIAEYRDEKTNNGRPYRVLCGPDFCRKLDPTFAGMPMVVLHDLDITVDNYEEKACGYVIESFFNKSDGMHWCKFLLFDDDAFDAIENKHWKLSNCYTPGTDTSGGGRWHGVDYLMEYNSGKGDHMAIVPNPRYEESIILTPEEFKKYNFEKEQELLKIANSKEQGEPMKFFKREKATQEIDVENLVVTLPKTKKELTLAKIINDFDEMDFNSSKPQMANGDHKVKIGESEMTVNELVEKYNAMCAEKANASAAQDEEAKKKALELAEHEDEELEEKAMNEQKEKEEAEKKANDEKAAKEKEEAEKKKSNAAHFEKMKNAADEAKKIANSQKVVQTGAEALTRGKSRYGSN